MRSLNFYRGQVFGKWGPTNWIFFILSILSIIIGIFLGGHYILNISSNRNQADINNTSLINSPVCIGENCQQNINVYTGAPSKNNSIILTPTSIDVKCERSDLFLKTLKITNNLDYPIFEVQVGVYTNSTELTGQKLLTWSESALDKKNSDLGPAGIHYYPQCLYGTDGGIPAEIIYFKEVNAHDTLDLEVLTTYTNCTKDYRLELLLLNYSKDSYGQYAEENGVPMTAAYGPGLRYSQVFYILGSCAYKGQERKPRIKLKISETNFSIFKNLSINGTFMDDMILKQGYRHFYLDLQNDESSPEIATNFFLRVGFPGTILRITKTERGISCKIKADNASFLINNRWTELSPLDGSRISNILPKSIGNPDIEIECGDIPPGGNLRLSVLVDGGDIWNEDSIKENKSLEKYLLESYFDSDFPCKLPTLCYKGQYFWRNSGELQKEDIVPQ